MVARDVGYSISQLKSFRRCESLVLEVAMKLEVSKILDKED